MNTFLERVTALEQGTDPDRKESREEDRKAIELLRRRNIIRASEEEQLREYIQIATSQFPSVDTSTTPKENLQRAAHQFMAWLEDWGTTARAEITRRDYLISLGLARRRTNKKEQTNPTTPVTSTDIPTIPVTSTDIPTTD